MADRPKSQLHERKRELRREIRCKIELLTPAVRASAAAELCRRLAAHPKVADAPWVAAFMALKNEPDLSVYLQARLRRGLPLLLPRIVGDPKNGIMEMRVVRSWAADFRPGPLGILEPGDHCEVFAATATPGTTTPSADGKIIDVVLVPGLAFDRAGHRMGKGAGHYDRFLSMTPVNWKVGIGFVCQRVDTVPVEKHDVTLDEVLLG